MSAEYRLVVPNEYTYRIRLADKLYFQCIGKPPNAFHRMMLRLVFGWRIEVMPKDRGRE